MNSRRFHGMLTKRGSCSKIYNQRTATWYQNWIIFISWTSLKLHTCPARALPSCPLLPPAKRGPGDTAGCSRTRDERVGILGCRKPRLSARRQKTEVRSLSRTLLPPAGGAGRTLQKVRTSEIYPPPPPSARGVAKKVAPPPVQVACGFPPFAL